MTAHNTFNNVRVLTHSAIRLKSQSGTVIYVDPFDLVEEFFDADAVLFTHDHFDHYSPNDVAKVAAGNTQFIAPATCTDSVLKDHPQAIGLKPGDTITVKDVEIQAVPAYNVEPERLGFHPQQNRWLGYVFTIDGVRYYVAGDTDQNPENENLNVDVALIPVGGTYTMDPIQAATFINTFTPPVAIPTHYGTVVGPREAGDQFAPLVDPATTVLLKMEWH